MNQYNSALNQLGVTAIEAVGQPFDANRHNAVMHIEDDAYGEGVVVEEFEKGLLHRRPRAAVFRCESRKLIPI